MSEGIAFENLPGLHQIFLDYTGNFERVSQFFHIDYRKPVDKWSHLREIENPLKEDLIEGLLADAKKWNCHKNSRGNIEALRDPDTLAVVTGQQVGLFGGPLLTFYKALSAVLWAKRIEEVTKRRTVPIFWMETSDHDFFEINSIRILDRKGEESTLSLSQAPPEKRTVVGSITLGEEINQLLRRLYHLLPANTYRGSFIETLSSFYRQGEKLGDAFAKLYSLQFGRDGLILFDAENALCKQAVSPLLDRILESGDKLNETLEATTRKVTESGYQPQIQPQNDRLQLFLKEDEVRIPLDSRGTILYEEKQKKKLGIERLRSIAREEPGNLLPKVSLRPIMQDYLFPTAAYLAGPSEIAYFAQLKPLYDCLDVKMPAIVPRLSMTLLDNRTGKLLEKYKLTLKELHRGPSELINQRLESDPSSDIVGLFAEARKKWEELNAQLSHGMIQIDPTLEHTVEKTMIRWQQGLNVLEEKARASLSEKNKTLVSQIQKCCQQLAPSGVFQERRYSLPYYLARYGRSFCESIRSQARIDLFEHQMITLK